MTARVSRNILYRLLYAGLPSVFVLFVLFVFFLLQCHHLQLQYRTALSVGVRKMPLSCTSRSHTSCVASLETNLSLIFPVLLTELEVEDNPNATKQ